jgi:hypothetical protein
MVGKRCVSRFSFGMALPQHWAPLGPKVVVLRNTQGCVSCSSGGTVHICLNNIAAEDVIKLERPPRL